MSVKTRLFRLWSALFFGSALASVVVVTAKAVGSEADITQLIQIYRNLNPNHVDDHDRGFLNLNKVMRVQDEFKTNPYKIAGSVRELNFLAELSALALPFDPEGVMPVRFKAAAKRQGFSESQIRAAMDHIGSKCHRLFFQDQLIAQECAEKVRGGVAVNSKGKSIELCRSSSFDFKKCKP